MLIAFNQFFLSLSKTISQSCYNMVHTAHLPKFPHCDVTAKVKSSCFISSKGHHELLNHAFQKFQSVR